MHAIWPKDVQGCFEIKMDLIVERYPSINENICVYSKLDQEHESNLFNLM